MTPATIRVLHWLVAASVLFLFISSWWMLSLPLPSENFSYRELPFQLHKNIGISVLLLVVIMIAVRVRQRRLNPADSGSGLVRLVELDHVLTYLLLIACCASGYLSSSFSGWGTSWWWLIEFPAWSEENDGLNLLFSDIHLWTCWALLAVIVLHISAALYHAFANDGALGKMFRLR